MQIAQMERGLSISDHSALEGIPRVMETTPVPLGQSMVSIAEKKYEMIPIEEKEADMILFFNRNIKSVALNYDGVSHALLPGKTKCIPDL